MKNDPIKDRGYWSVHEAIAVSFDEFSRRYGADLLWKAFQSLTRNHDAILREHTKLEADIGKFTQFALYIDEAKLDGWVSETRHDDYGIKMLHHMGIRWWLSRDDLMTRPPQTRVPCVYTEGMSGHVSLQLLRQMLYRGRAPYTTCD